MNNLSRRQIGRALAGIAAGVAAQSPSARAQERAAKPGLLWGVATSAYQVEGNNLNTDIWLLEQLPGGFFREASGDACDHYHREFSARMRD
jgi:beta-glucosidase